MSEHTTSPDPSRRPTPASIPRITTVRSALQDATNDATELGDLMAAALAADDQQRHATVAVKDLLPERPETAATGAELVAAATGAGR